LVCDTKGSSKCEPANACGNGVVESYIVNTAMYDEYCDDGNATNGDGCNSTCKIETGYNCGNYTWCASGICVSGTCQ
jgi:cysteine-rich repeat protein